MRPDEKIRSEYIMRENIPLSHKAIGQPTRESKPDLYGSVFTQLRLDNKSRHLVLPYTNIAVYDLSFFKATVVY